MMVFVPVTHHQAKKLRSGHELGRRAGCAATESLVSSLGRDTSTEEAEYAALNHAGVLALVHDGDQRRTVLAVEVPDDQIIDHRTYLGEIDVERFTWSQVRSLFADADDAGEAVAQARLATGVAGLAEALATREVGQLLDDHDLLWFATDELDQL